MKAVVGILLIVAAAAVMAADDHDIRSCDDIVHAYCTTAQRARGNVMTRGMNAMDSDSDLPALSGNCQRCEEAVRQAYQTVRDRYTPAGKKRPTFNEFNVAKRDCQSQWDAIRPTHIDEVGVRAESNSMRDQYERWMNEARANGDTAGFKKWEGYYNEEISRFTRLAGRAMNFKDADITKPKNTGWNKDEAGVEELLFMDGCMFVESACASEVTKCGFNAVTYYEAATKLDGLRGEHYGVMDEMDTIQRLGLRFDNGDLRRLSAQHRPITEKITATNEEVDQLLNYVQGNCPAYDRTERRVTC